MHVLFLHSYMITCFQIIQYIVFTAGETTCDAQASKSSVAAGTPNAGGDTSPIKEYLMRHKWANKWDKRSLSLDLDFKGKIITAIEDKRKKMVSHFIPEESSSNRSSSPMPQSHSIPELGSMTTATSSTSISSDGGCQGNTVTPSNFSNTLYGEKSASSNNLLGEYSSLPSTGEEDEFEEIGTDPLDITPLVDPYFGQDASLQSLKFIVPADELLDGDFHGPLSSSTSSFIPLVAPFGMSSEEQNASNSSEAGRVDTKGVSAGTASSAPLLTPSQLYYENTMEDLSFSHLVYTMIWDVIRHNNTKYWIGLLALNILVPWGSFLSSVVWFLLGSMGTGIVFSSLVDVRTRDTQQQQDEEKSESLKRMEQNLSDAVDRSPLRNFEDEVADSNIKVGDLKIPTVCQVN